MNPDLEKLVRLHRVESDLKRVESELAAIPRLRQEIEDRLARDRSHLEAARAALAGSQKARKEHESSVADLKAKLSKYKGQLMEVKTKLFVAPLFRRSALGPLGLRTRSLLSGIRLGRPNR